MRIPNLSQLGYSIEGGDEDGNSCKNQQVDILSITNDGHDQHQSDMMKLKARSDNLTENNQPDPNQSHMEEEIVSANYQQPGTLILDENQRSYIDDDFPSTTQHHEHGIIDISESNASLK